MDERYDRQHMYGDVKFYLSFYTPDEEQCRMLMLKLLEQSVRDYCSLSASQLGNEQLIWQEARAFLFDNEYQFNWGEYELTLESFLDIIDLDIDWVREQTQKKFEARKR
jgi:hypothetical protein